MAPDEQIAANRQLVVHALQPAVVALGAAFVLVAVVAFLTTLLLIPVALVAVAALAYGAVQMLRSSPDHALRLVGARPAPESEFPRLHNVTEGLSASTGIAAPALYVVDDPTVNAFAVGIEARDARLVVTSGLVESLEPVEMEGVLAQQLSHVRALDILPATIAVRVAPLRARLPELRELLADRAAIGITRYPPGLQRALIKARAQRGAGDPGPAALVHLWMDPPGSDSDALDLRIDVLEEL